MIERFYTTAFIVKRQVWSGDSSALVNQSTFSGHIQQGVPDDYQQYEGLRFSKAFTIWCGPATDIKEGDRIEQGSTTYDVRFSKNRNVGNEGHLEVIVEKSDE
ncbi:MAG: hypothetical protein ACTSUF_07715 [Candidatus Heimdallarchaeaceae archaeon]